jgi:surfeit locus 1 family protein
MSLALFVVLLRLGFWQLDRAAQKKEIATEYADRLTAPVLDLAEITDPDPEQIRWRRVRATGTYMKPDLLLDNRTRSGKVGFDVLSPFRLVTGTTVLVERGWIAGASTRDDYPEITTPANPLQIDGYAGPPVFSGLRMNRAADAVENLQPALVRIQRIDFEMLAPYLGATLAPYIVYLDPAAPHGYDRRRPVPGDGTARHQAYATQWFSMAAILVVIMAALIYRNKNRVDPN